MTVVSFDDAACALIRRRLDSYLSGELAPDAAAEVERHLAGCERCSAEFAAMEDLRSRLRRAVRGEALPPGLFEAVRGRVERDGRRRVAPWLAVAAALAVTVGGGYVASKRITGFYPHKLLAIELEVRSLVREVAAAYAPAIIDHVHCALYRAGSKSEVMPEKVAMELGDQAPIAGIVKEAAGPDATLVVAHKCHFGGREYIHMILMEGESLVSVVVTEKREGETLGAGLASDRAGEFEIAGFEAGAYLAFVISDMPAEKNLTLARNLEAPLQGFLSETL